MKNTMKFKNYVGTVEYSEEDNCLFGRLLGISDIISYEGDSVVELRAAFEEAVEDYWETCEKIGKAPQRPYSGKVMLRISPELHAEIAMRAEASGKSLNQWAADTLSHAQ
jgi:predicted HicB family RNase H-like nuclease